MTTLTFYHTCQEFFIDNGIFCEKMILMGFLHIIPFHSFCFASIINSR